MSTSLWSVNHYIRRRAKSLHTCEKIIQSSDSYNEIRNEIPDTRYYFHSEGHFGDLNACTEPVHVGMQNSATALNVPVALQVNKVFDVIKQHIDLCISARIYVCRIL
jgi:hypothetical protein